MRVLKVVKKFKNILLISMLVLSVALLSGCVDKVRDAVASYVRPGIDLNIDVKLIPDVNMGKGSMNRIALPNGTHADNLTIDSGDHVYDVSISSVEYFYKIDMTGSSDIEKTNVRINGEVVDVRLKDGREKEEWVFEKETILSAELPAENYKLVISGQLERDIEIIINDVAVDKDENGHFTKEFLNGAGVSYINIEVKDARNNRSSLKLEVKFNDKVPNLTIDEISIPTKKFVDKIRDEVKTITEFNKLKLRGFTGEESKLFVGNQELAVGAGGMFETEIELQPGENVSTFRSESKNGNAIEVNVNIKYNVTKRPELTVNIPQNEMAAEDMITKFHTIEVSGMTDVGCDVFINGEKVRVKRDGSFSHQVELKAGTNIITVLSVDKDGNSTELVRRVTFTSDDFPLKIFAPEESTNVSVEVSGLTKPETVVFLENTKTEVEEDGSFSGTLQLTKPGNNVFTITAIDKYGNSQTRSVVIKGIPPRVEVVAPEITTNPEVTIVGVTDANSTVVMLVGGKRVPVNNNDGTFEISVELEPGLNDLVLLATNFFGTTEMPVPIIYDDYAAK
ncbi:MAG: hypothetical protein LRZ91_04730 [Desulfotomaculum sp.]|nr:hypothetical protein [Desulfotomaculum sp.]